MEVGQHGTFVNGLVWTWWAKELVTVLYLCTKLKLNLLFSSIASDHLFPSQSLPIYIQFAAKIHPCHY